MAKLKKALREQFQFTQCFFTFSDIKHNPHSNESNHYYGDYDFDSIWER